MPPEAADAIRSLGGVIEELTEAVNALATYLGHRPGGVLQAWGDLLTLLAAFLLVGATLWSVRVLRKQRKAAIMPAIIVRSDGERANMLNVGNGIAVNVEAWVTDAQGSPCSHVRAESIGGKVPEFPVSWNPEEGPRNFGLGVVVWIRYQDAEGDWHHSHRDCEQKWTIKPGRGRLPKTLEGSSLIGAWENEVSAG